MFILFLTMKTPNGLFTLGILFYALILAFLCPVLRKTVKCLDAGIMCASCSCWAASLFAVRICHIFRCVPVCGLSAVFVPVCCIGNALAASSAGEIGENGGIQIGCVVSLLLCLRDAVPDQCMSVFAHSQFQPEKLYRELFSNAECNETGILPEQLEETGL